MAQGGAPFSTVPCLHLGDGCHSEVLEKEVREHGSEERDIRCQEPEWQQSQGCLCLRKLGLLIPQHFSVLPPSLSHPILSLSPAGG